MFSAPEPPAAVLARNATLFEVKRSTLAAYTVTLELSEDIPGRRTAESFRLSHTMLLRNR